MDMDKLIKDFSEAHNVDGYYRRDFDIATMTMRLVVQLQRGDISVRSIYITNRDGTIDPTHLKDRLETLYLELERKEAAND